MKWRSYAPILLAALALAFALAPAGSGKVAHILGGQCGSPPCWSTFTINGGAPPAGVTLSVSTAGPNVQIAVLKSGQTELSPSVTTSDAIHMVLDLGTYDPVVFGTTGLISSYSESTGADNTITLDVKPSASSWSMGGCSVISCGSDAAPVTATNDFSSVVLGFISDLSTSGASSAVKNAMRGTWFSTNAQALALPTFNIADNSVSFTVAAPHFKSDATTVNTGFFEFFAPDALVEQMGIVDPTLVNNGSFNVASSASSAPTFDVGHVTGPDGVLIESGTNPPTLPMFHFSSPKFTVSKAATVPDAPSGISAAAGDGQATISFTAPTSNGGAAITSYTVTSAPGGIAASGSASPITMSGLTNGTGYTFSVKATNSVGSSVASSASASVTPSAPAVVVTPSAPAAVAPAVVAPVTITEQSSGTTSATIAANESASLGLGDGKPTLSWSDETFSGGVDVTAVTGDPAALTGFAAGSTAVELSFTSGGSPVTQFSAPLELVFPGPAATLVPGYSTDGGTTWHGIPQLTGTSLPDAQQDGWYRSGDGAVHILSRHATYFGLLAGLDLKAGNRPSFPVGAKRIFVYLAPGRAASGTLTLEDRHGKTIRTMSVSLPASSTRVAIPLRAGLAPGLYLVKLALASGPATASTTLRVRLGAHR